MRNSFSFAALMNANAFTIFSGNIKYASILMVQQYYHIREATNGDIPALARLYRSFAAEQIAYSPIVKENPQFDWSNELRAVLNSGTQKLFVADAGEIAGFIWVFDRSASSKKPSRNPLKRWKSKRRQPQPKIYNVPNGMIQDCYVASKFRRLGIGAALVNAAKDWFLSKGIEDVVLMVMRENSAGVNFWEKMGFSTYRMIMHQKLRTE